MSLNHVIGVRLRGIQPRRFGSYLMSWVLSRIKLIGLEAWGKEAAMIQQKYFKGKFAYGQGPIVDGDS